MVQKEVAHKFCAKAGDRDFCGISVVASSVADCEILFDVPPEAFTPIPKVISSVMLLSKNIDTFDEEFSKFIKLSFASPRKTLIRNLLAIYTKEQLEPIFAKCNIEHSIRPHQLNFDKFYELYTCLYS
jgi:16S rRNA (adenine1518-N6/adenine1519-N6)-dimethyltransferase